MIKNEHQFRVTQGQIERFEQALAEPSRRGFASAVRRKALRSQLNDLQAEAQEYVALCSGAYKPRPPMGFLDVGRFLIQTRLARGWTQRELAELSGLHEQQIQRYEANDYEQASLARICEIAHALGVDHVPPCPPTTP